MTSTTHTRQTSSNDPVAVTACHLYDAECALHTAHQSHVDAWAEAASHKLHQALVGPPTLLRVVRLQASAEHVRTCRIPLLGEADDYFCPPEQTLVISVIGDVAYLDLHPADPDLGRPIYPARASIRVPVADLI